MCRGLPGQSSAFWSKDAASLQGASEKETSLPLLFPLLPVFPHSEPAWRFLLQPVWAELLGQVQ